MTAIAKPVVACMLAVMAGRGNNNLSYLARIWGVAVAFLVLAFVPWFFGPQQHVEYMPMLIGAAVGVTVLLVLRYRLRHRFERAFLAPGPDALIEQSQRAFARMRVPHARHLLALGMASARAYYGQFGRARDELDEISWDGIPDLYRGGALQIRALIHYLSRDDVAAGLRMAHEAEALVQVPRFAPGAKTSRRVTASYVDIGRVLAEGASAELADALTARIKSFASPQERLLTMWGAAVARHALGQHAEAQALFSQLKQLAPHCRPLHEEALHDRPRAAQQEDQPTSGACARHPELRASARCVRCGNFSCEACTHRLPSNAAVCADCRERYREQREEHLRAESRLRTAGLVVQTGSVLGASVAVIAGLWFASDPALQPMLVLVPAFAIWSLLFWIAGGVLRRLDMGLRRQAVVASIPLLGLMPIGTIAAGYLLWLAFGPSGRALQSLDHQRAISATPELEPKPRWGLCAALVLLLALNALAPFALLVYARY